MKIDKVLPIYVDNKLELPKKISEVVDQVKAENSYSITNIVRLSDVSALVVLSKVQANQGYVPKQLSESNVDKATSRQLNYLRQLANRTHKELSDDQLANLSKKDAGKMIGKLKKEAEGSQEKDQSDFGTDFDMSELDQMKIN